MIARPATGRPPRPEAIARPAAGRPFRPAAIARPAAGRLALPAANAQPAVARPAAIVRLAAGRRARPIDIARRSSLAVDLLRVPPLKTETAVRRLSPAHVEFETLSSPRALGRYCRIC